MEHKRIKNYVIIFINLSLCFNVLQSQTSLNLLTKSGTETYFNLADIAKLTFSAGNITVNKKDATFNTFALSEIQNLNFGLKTSVSEFSDPGSTKLILYPIPVLNDLNVQFSAMSFSNAQLQIIDLTGKVVLQQSLSCQTGTNYKTISVLDLKHGLYLCLLKQGNKLETSKFLKD